jgi:hypothetical protein
VSISPDSRAWILLRELLNGKVSLREAHRFYEAAAEAQQHNPDLAKQLEEMGDKGSVRRSREN